MFTGLIQSVGRVQRRRGGVLVEGCARFSPLTIGESISVDGICLTVAEVSGEDGFFAIVSEETLSRTSLGRKAEKGSFVNLEPALRFSDRLGGHLVSGHIDGLGIVVALEELQNSRRLEVRWADKTFGKYLCEKGSIALDGVSLTVAGCVENGSQFWMAVIPHTWDGTTLQNLVVGSEVNLEVDLLAKYSERFWQVASKKEIEKNNILNKVSKDWLSENGWY
ncbi:riboflavin synthase [Prochlorococcus sp. MIT 1341]|uniref:riboflavin synthase n=1 Tax=Prochlorococcus sp. MIT 1341 TaxID=3096221 RepID=UPI002A759977|nr:riboflavin synthase [Prochlorococcus sp. MIT 1341]